jgi:hypothetical protein
MASLIRLCEISDTAQGGKAAINDLPVARPKEPSTRPHLIQL